MTGTRLFARYLSSMLWLTIASLAACDTVNYDAKEEAKTPLPPVIASWTLVVGAKLQLRVPLDLPAGGTPLMFQSNAIVTQPGLAKNLPYCRFAGETSGAPRALKPATFTVRDIDYDERRSAAGPRPVGVTSYKLSGDGGKPEYVLSCQWPEGAPTAAFVTNDEVRATVSAFFSQDPVR